MDSINEDIKKSIIEGYLLIIKDFFDVVSKNSELLSPNLCVGINTINRVFEYTMIKTKCIEKTKYYSQKSYYYYLEYIDQIKSLYLYQSLNDMDAVLFVYKKTIFDLANDDSLQSMNAFTIRYEPMSIEDIDLTMLLKKIFKLTNTLFYWDNMKLTFINRQNVCDNFLSKFLKRIAVAEYIYMYLEMIQHKIEMDNREYELLLTEYTEKKIKKNEDDYKETFLIKFYVDETVLIDKFNSGNMKDFLKWIYSPI